MWSGRPGSLATGHRWRLRLMTDGTAHSLFCSWMCVRCRIGSGYRGLSSCCCRGEGLNLSLNVLDIV